MREHTLVQDYSGEFELRKGLGAGSLLQIICIDLAATKAKIRDLRRTCSRNRFCSMGIWEYRIVCADRTGCGGCDV